jgi:hypothetical protein
VQSEKANPHIRPHAKRTDALRTLGILALLLESLLVALAAPVTVTPTLTAGHEAEWVFLAGKWTLADGILSQGKLAGLSSALLKEPCLSDVELSVDFNIKPQGSGVRAAAIVLRATGTLSYYWVHLDSHSRNVILVRATPENSWLEITRTHVDALTDDAWHTVKAAIKGDVITISLDDKQIITAKDAVIPAGRIGLGTSEGHVSYRNLKIEGEKPEIAAPLKDETRPPPIYKIISEGDAAGPYQAFPDICRLTNGDLLAVFYAGYGHVSLPDAEWPKGGRVCMVRSSDEGKTWTTPAILFDDDQDNRDPHIAQISDGSILCSFFSYWKAEGGAMRYCSKTVRSTDGGQTWDTTAQAVTPEMWAASAPVREMPDGTLILGVYAGGGFWSYGGVVRSTDKGKTWSAPIPIGKEAKLPLDAETDVILLKDGTLYAALRSSIVNMHYATSRDLGLTWSPVKDIGFKGHAPHFTRLSTGEVLLSHRLPDTSLHVSRDDCATWQGPYVLDTVGGAYPATVELKDGTVLAIYYTEGEGSHIRVLRFKLNADGIEKLELK